MYTTEHCWHALRSILTVAAFGLFACGGGASIVTDATPTDTQEDLSTPDLSVEPEFNPGAVTLHRLNRAEYNNTVRDLLGDDTQPAKDFPADDHGYGFDNIADVLSMSPLLMEKYDRAAERLLDDTLYRPTVSTQALMFQAEAINVDLGGSSGEFWNLWASGGEAWTTVSLSEPGVYQFTVRAAGQQAGPDLTQMRLRVDDETQDVEVAAHAASASTYKTVFTIEAGDHDIAVRLVNDYYEPDLGEDRNLLVDWLELKGPYPENTGLSHWEGEALLPSASVMGFGVLSSGDPLSEPWTATRSGTHEFEVRVTKAIDSTSPATLALVVDGVVAETWEILSPSDLATLVQAEISLEAGAHNLELQHLDGPEILVDFFRVFGPTDLEQPPDPPRRAAVMICDPADSEEAACTRTILEAFARRAWRRPIADKELEKLEALALLGRETTGDFEMGIRTALHATLLSPHFIFRVELDPELGTGIPHKISQHELATRLSYALWSSMPDPELDGLADQGSLHDPDVLVAQVRRMLEDERSQAVIDNFAGQWLKLRKMGDLVRDSVLFPEFDDSLSASMRKSTELSFTEYLRTPLDFLTLLTTDVQYIDPILAQHYGVEPPQFDEFERRNLGDPNRHGILSQASILSLTSHTFGTSPVLRGKWILSQWMCQEPPPPPPEVDTLLEPDPENYVSKREQLAQHREDPMCASCHSMMDPLGLALENYDAIGRWRDYDGPFLIDPSGELPSGDTFANPLEMAQIVRDDPSTSTCVARHLFTYLMGRGVEAHDIGTLNEINETWSQNGYTLEALFIQIVQSPLFTQRMPPELPTEETE